MRCTLNHTVTAIDKINTHIHTVRLITKEFLLVTLSDGIRARWRLVWHRVQNETEDRVAVTAQDVLKNWPILRSRIKGWAAAAAASYVACQPECLSKEGVTTAATVGTRHSTTLCSAMWFNQLYRANFVQYILTSLLYLSSAHLISSLYGHNMYATTTTYLYRWIWDLLWAP